MNLQRICLVFIYITIFFNKQKLSLFILEIKKNAYTGLLLIFFLICLFTSIVRNDINTFFGFFIDWGLTFYLLIFLMKYSISYQQIFNLIKKYLYFVCILGLLEFLLQINFFEFFSIHIGNASDVIEASYRDSMLRVRGPYGHSLAYGMVLNLFYPLICYNFIDKKINIFQNKFLSILILFNIFFTGGRSSLALFLVEVLVLYLLTPNKLGNSFMTYTIIFLIILFLILVVFGNSDISVFLKKQFFYVFDEIFGTNKAIIYGGDSSIQESSVARDRIWKIFAYPSLNPWIGQGVSKKMNFFIDNWNVTSIDNYYVSLYIMLGIPGLFVVLLICLKSIIDVCIYKMQKCTIYFKRNPLLLLIGLSIVVYLINLLYVHEISTFKYLFFLIGLMQVIKDEDTFYCSSTNNPANIRKNERTTSL